MGLQIGPLSHFKDLEKLSAALAGKANSRLNDLGMMTGTVLFDEYFCLVINLGFHHTGPIENFNSLKNKYASKAYVYG